MEAPREYKMGRLWTVEEDRILTDYVNVHGKGKWNLMAKLTGLKRNGKSCRLRWKNYLSPDIKRGNFSKDEEDLVIRLHKLLGNRWSLIAGRIPGRTDNQVKKHFNKHVRKKLNANCKSSNTTSSSNHETRINNDRGGGSMIMNGDDEQHSPIGSTGVNNQEENKSDSLWFCNKKYDYFCSPSSMELVDLESMLHDLDWHGVL